MAEAQATETPQQRAEESVAARFTRLMNACTSPLGVLTDPPLVALSTGVLLIAFLAALGAGASVAVVRALAALMTLPVAVALVFSLVLRSARRRVVDWLARQPFPVDNMNALLNGVGEALEVSFGETLPTTEELNRELDQIHPDCFVTDTVQETRTVEIRIGVVDSKRNPAASNHRRYARVLSLVERVLGPLSARHPITGVRVK